MDGFAPSFAGLHLADCSYPITFVITDQLSTISFVQLLKS